jgi:hypothetical protein
MSALAIQIRPTVAELLPGRRQAATRVALAAAILGALAPWLLLIGAHGGLARSAATCLAGPLPV